MFRKTKPLFGYWFKRSYYDAFAEPLSTFSKRVVPETEDAVDELLLFQVDLRRSQGIVCRDLWRWRGRDRDS